MPLARCLTCHGSGRVMGGGMLTHDCDECDGRGKIEKVALYDKVKHSPEYNRAIDKIATNENISSEEAEKVFKQELDKIEVTEKRKGKKK